MFDNAGFLLSACNKNDRKYLQIIQNNCLRTCYNVRLLDRLTLIDMHREANLVSLEQGRQIQLLSLLSIYRSIGNVERIFARNTRQGRRFNFRVDNYQSGKYKSSPYFKGTILGDRLPDNVINLLTLLSPYSTGNWVCVGCPTPTKLTWTTWNVHAQRENFALVTQRHLYSTDWRRGLASGVTQILGFGVVFRYQHVGIPNAKFWRWGSKPTPGPNANVFASQWNMNLKRS